MYSNKRQQVQQIKNENIKDIARKELLNEEVVKERAIKRESIRQMAHKGKQNVDAYRQTKAQMTRQEMKAKTEEEKKLIYKFEKEAQQLEQLEEKLIQRL